jgi:hypothetical protein
MSARYDLLLRISKALKTSGIHCNSYVCEIYIAITIMIGVPFPLCCTAAFLRNSAASGTTRENRCNTADGYYQRRNVNAPYNHYSIFMMQFLLKVALVFVIAGCAHSQYEHAAEDDAKQVVRDEAITEFSANMPGGLPDRWTPLIIHRTKKRTEYQLVAEDGETILHARAVGASSALMQHVNVDPGKQQWLSWRWRIGNLIASAKNFQRHAEDSPARLILGFDGDKDTLSFTDQVLFETARVLTGHDFSYATLMYVWENTAPVGTIIDSTRSGRIKMIVASSGSDGIGQWHEFTRNIAEDFEGAFGEKPGKLIGVGVLTDTDNTGETVDAWYGDIRLINAPRIAAKSSQAR